MTDGDYRVTVALPRSLAEQIDTYWHTNRHRSKTAAMRELLAFGLEHAKAARAALAPDKPRRPKAR